MRTCSSCGRQNPADRDFCECGEYLRWEPTGFVPAVPAPPAMPPDPDGRRGDAQRPQAERELAKTAVDHRAAPLPARPAPQPAPQGTVRPPAREPAAVVLRLPDREVDEGQTLRVQVQPGERARVLALVRNQSGIVDNYDLRVDGLPEGWWTCIPDTVYLVPYGTGGVYEQEVEVHLHPPRTPDAQARAWDVRVVAHSRDAQRGAAAARLTVEIGPYVDTSTTIRPERAKGRRRAEFSVAVENRANAPVLVALEGVDSDDELEFGFDRPPQEVPPGATARTSMRVTAPRQIWIGRARERRLAVNTLIGEEAAARLAQAPVPTEHVDAPLRDGRRGPFGRLVSPPTIYRPQVHGPSVDVGPGGISFRGPQLRGPAVQGPRVGALHLDLSSRTGGGAAVAPSPSLPPSQAVFRQLAWLPWWLVPVALALAALLATFFLLLPRTVEVPKVEGLRSAFDAEQALVEAGLRLAATPKERTTDASPPGSVLAQTPEGGAKAEKGTEVTILVAVGSGTATVPDLTGKTLVQAEKLLRSAGFTLGRSSPQPPEPQARIASHIPPADEVLKQGSPVDIFFADPKGQRRGAGAGGEDGDGQGGAGKAGGRAVVPAIGSLTAQAYAQALADKELVPEVRRRYADAPRGKLLGTIPKGGTELPAGGSVKLLVSAGFPQLAFDDGEDILLINGASGERVGAIAQSSQSEKDPTFSPDGGRIAFQSAGHIFVAERADPAETRRQLTAGDAFYRDLAWAPTTRDDVLAVLRSRDDGKRQLCFGRVSARRMKPRCATPPPDGIVLDRKISWSPDGRSLLIFGTTPRARVFGMVRYRSAKAFSADPANWRTPGYVTDVTNPGRGVLDATLAPDGRTLAAVANTKGPGPFRLFRARPGDLLLASAKPLGVGACQVTWRPDGREVVVVQADDCSAAENGRLVRLPIAHPKDHKQLRLGGDNPTFQPLTLRE